MRALERGELAPAQGAAQKHRQNRAVPFSFDGFELRLSEEVAGLKGRPSITRQGRELAYPGTGHHDSRGHGVIEQIVFGGFCGLLADRGQSKNQSKLDCAGSGRKTRNMPARSPDGAAIRGEAAGWTAWPF